MCVRVCEAGRETAQNFYGIRHVAKARLSANSGAHKSICVGGLCACARTYVCVHVGRWQ